MDPVNALYRMPEKAGLWENCSILKFGDYEKDVQFQKVLIVLPDGSLLWADMSRIKVSVTRN